jgi:hypothetical protein
MARFDLGYMMGGKELCGFRIPTYDIRDKKATLDS